jgi:hypothetical protein
LQEKLDRVRECAGCVLHRLVHRPAGAVAIPHVPERSALAAAFAR